MTINPISFACTPIETFAATGARLDKATGFFFRRDDKWSHLVTNWHIVTGRSPLAPGRSRTGAVPCYLNIAMHRRFPNGKVYRGEQGLRRFRIELNTEDGQNPEWHEHPHHRWRVDVVVLRIPSAPFAEDTMCNYVEELSNLEPRLRPEVMDDVFVVGYPWGLSGGSEVLPIYKRGAIASEADVDIDRLPNFLVDCRTASGMSGSPVICSRSGIWNPGEEPSLSDDSIIGTVQSFAGVYSGRMIEDESLGDEKGQKQREISEIGRVWKVAALKEVVDSGVTGSKLSDIIAAGRT